MGNAAQTLFDLIIKDPNPDALVGIIESGLLRSSDPIPNIFDGMTINEVFFVLSLSDNITSERREVFAEMASIAAHACSVEEELDHTTHDAVVKSLRTLRM